MVLAMNSSFPMDRERRGTSSPPRSESGSGVSRYVVALPLPLRTAALCQRRVAYRQVGKLWRPYVKRLK